MQILLQKAPLNIETCANWNCFSQSAHKVRTILYKCLNGVIVAVLAKHAMAFLTKTNLIFQKIIFWRCLHEYECYDMNLVNVTLV